MSDGERPNVSLRVKLKYPDVETFLARYSGNISKGGIFIASKTPRPVGERLSFELLLAGGQPVVVGVGEVIWVKPFDPAQPVRPHGMGLRFISLDPASRVIVERALRSKDPRSETRPRSANSDEASPVPRPRTPTDLQAAPGGGPHPRTPTNVPAQPPAAPRPRPPETPAAQPAVAARLRTPETAVAPRPRTATSGPGDADTAQRQRKGTPTTLPPPPLRPALPAPPSARGARPPPPPPRATARPTVGSIPRPPLPRRPGMLPGADRSRDRDAGIPTSDDSPPPADAPRTRRPGMTQLLVNARISATAQLANAYLATAYLANERVVDELAAEAGLDDTRIEAALARVRSAPPATDDAALEALLGPPPRSPPIPIEEAPRRLAELLAR